jgi:anti-sigma regulatory factor (Ser/Thr protein kinase)
MRELSLHILDILQNSVEAGATRVALSIVEDLAADRLTIEVRDNGRGIAPDKLPHVFDPFYTSRKTRHVGLGLPLLKAAAERCNGDATITSEVGAGATVTATFQHSHLDRAPLGDMVGTLMSFVLGGACELGYVHRVVGRLVDWEDGRSGGAGRRVDKETRKHGDEVENWETRAFAFDTAELRAELGDVPLAHPEVREWLRQFINESETALAQV